MLIWRSLAPGTLAAVLRHIAEARADYGSSPAPFAAAPAKPNGSSSVAASPIAVATSGRAAGDTG